MSVQSEHDSVRHGAAQKLHYISSELVDDLSVFQWRRLAFWTMLVLLALSFYLRAFLHYAGQYIWLAAMNLPISAFTPTPYSVRLDYPTDNASAASEMLMVLIGPLFNLGLFVFLCAFAACWQYALSPFPDAGSRFLAAYGIMTVLDPLITLIIDAASANTTAGDAFKLSTYFSAQEGSAIPGAILTCFFDLFLFLLSAFVLYQYLLHIHMNGRMLDVFRRLHAPNAAFFAPDDLEVSVRNLRWILAQAKGWTGFHGAVRKIAVTSYVTLDHLDDRFESRTIHVAIYTQELAGQVRVRLLACIFVVPTAFSHQEQYAFSAASIIFALESHLRYLYSHFNFAAHPVSPVPATRQRLGD